MQSFSLIGGALLILGLTGGTGLADEPYHVRGTLIAVGDGVLTVENDDEEQLEVALSDETELYVVKPAKFADLKTGDFVGVTSVESGAQRVALEVHIFAEDLRGTVEGHVPWDLVKETNMMTNATIAEIKEASPVERVLRLTYKQGEGDGQSQGEQVISVPDFADVVLLEAAPDRSVLVPDRPVFLFVQDAPSGPPAALAIAVGQGVTPPM